MKKFVYIAASVVVLGGLLVASVVVHRNNVKSHPAGPSQLDIVKAVDTKNYNQLQTQFNQYKQTATTQFTNDQKALCGFIVQHTPKGVALPSECTANPL